jgi:hypothetical protein
MVRNTNTDDDWKVATPEKRDVRSAFHCGEKGKGPVTVLAETLLCIIELLVKRSLDRACNRGQESSPVSLLSSLVGTIMSALKFDGN